MLIGSESVPDAHIGALPEPIVKKIRRKELVDWFSFYARCPHWCTAYNLIVKKIRKKVLADWFRVCDKEK